MSFIWNELIVNPFTNVLLLLYDVLFNNFFLALAVFTILTRLAMLPINLRQQRSMMKTQEMQPEIQAIQKKYRDDPVKMQEKFKEIGYNPADSLMGCLPLLITMPIFIGLYRAIQFTLASTPQALYELSQRAYPFINLTELLPVGNKFSWLNLAQPDPFFVLPILVVATMFLSQKLMSPKKKDDSKKKKGQEDDPSAAAMQSMQYTMPLMFGLFSLQFPAGISVYFVLSNLISILQGFIVRNEREKAQAEMEAQKKAQKKKSKKKAKPTSAEAESEQPVATAPSVNGKAKQNGAVAATSGKKKSKRKK